MTPLVALTLVVTTVLVVVLFALVWALDSGRIQRTANLPEGLRRPARLSLFALEIAAAVVLFALTNAVACAGIPGAVAPTLGAIIGRVDVPRLLECASRSGMDRARCLGASVLTTALDVAVDKAAELAERAKDAANKGAGADDMTDREREELAVSLDKALEDVGREVAAAQ